MVIAHPGVFGVFRQKIYYLEKLASIFCIISKHDEITRHDILANQTKKLSNTLPDFNFPLMALR
ncbi:hypothetical protein BRYFOR_06095 [Marvinbryantia formatexigens DSM 14469]|uniref:Uncharacterized protein n=1 Tax=Marvinbryantia formatexigens DSM 14469 TaxID=478749 RepID=C6LBU9_9FIRM|nr:hypothetical protein BRYFOR_06095 [Marvinbryantia formatexigens DSM 14469]